MKLIAKAAVATSAAVCATLFSLNWSEQGAPSLSVESAQARIGRPLTPFSVAGVARRQYRRGAWGYGGLGYGLAGAAAVGTAAAIAGSSYYNNGYYGGAPYVATGWGYPGSYYGAYSYPGGYSGYGYPGSYGYYGGYANRSYVTGRPTLFPRYYGASYAAAGYPGNYYGGYAHRSYVTGRPTLFPRYYSGWSW